MRLLKLFRPPKRQTAKRNKAISRPIVHHSEGVRSLTTIFNVGTLRLTALGTFPNISIKLGSYFDRKQPALRIFDQHGDPLFTASVYCERGSLEPGHIFIKSWGDYDGVLQELERLHVVKRTGTLQKYGVQTAFVCEIMPLHTWGDANEVTQQ